MDLKDKIIEGDCVEVLSSIPSNTFDMVITSPPYDNLRKYKGFSFNFEKIAENIFRTLKPGRVLIWVVNDATIDGSETFLALNKQ